MTRGAQGDSFHAWPLVVVAGRVEVAARRADEGCWDHDADRAPRGELARVDASRCSALISSGGDALANMTFFVDVRRA